MQIVIDIPKDVYKRTVFYREFRDLSDCVATIKALENGTPLPKGHGRLIDAKEVDYAIYKRFENIPFYDGTGYDIYSDSKEGIDKIPTIIEADTAESEG